MSIFCLFRGLLISDKIVRILKMHSVPVTFRPLNTIRMSLKSANDPIDPKDMKVVYIIPCSCGTPYIGEMGRSISQRISEHAADLKHRRSKSSALAEHAEKKTIIMFVLRKLVSLLEFHRSIIENSGKLRRLKRGHAISIERMVGRSVDVGSQLSS